MREVIKLENLTMDRISKIVLDLLRSEGDEISFVLQPDTNLLETGLNSIRFVQLIVALEGTFDVEIPDSKLILSEMNTLKKIYDVLVSLQPGEGGVIDASVRSQ